MWKHNTLNPFLALDPETIKKFYFILLIYLGILLQSSLNKTNEEMRISLTDGRRGWTKEDLSLGEKIR